MPDSPAAEHSVDEEQVRTLLRHAVPDLAHLPLAQFADGWDNSLWRLGSELLVRLPRRALAVPLIGHEQRALPEIGPALAAVGIRTPVPIFSGLPNADFPWPWSIVPWIAGTPAIQLPRAENSQWAPQLAGTLGALHVTAPADAPLNPVRGRALVTRDEAMRPRLEQFSEHPALGAAWSAGLEAPRNTEDVWVHGDLHPGNVLVDQCRLSALIDFGDVTTGDPAYDLASSWMLFDAAGRDAFRAATTARYDEATWIRARAWAAYIALVFLTQSDDRPDHHAVGSRTVEALAEG